MSHFKTPQQKKLESYKHDRVEGGEYPHADRKNRPRAKALAQRRQRRVMKQISAQPDEVQREQQFGPGWIKSSVRLPDHLEKTVEHRIVREAHNLFRRGYSPATHARFQSVIESWMRSGSAHSMELANFYARVLFGFPNEALYYGQEWLLQRRYFLKRFFLKEPQLQLKFQNWITKLTGMR